MAPRRHRGAPTADARGFGTGTAFADLDGAGNLVVVGAGTFWWYAEGKPTQDGALAQEAGFLPEGVSLDGVVAGHFSSTEGSDFVLYGRRTDGTGGYLGVLRGGPGDIGSSYSVPAEGGASGGAAWDRAVAAGDINGDGYDDLVTGNTDVADGGSFTVRYGKATGLAATGKTYTQASPGVPGTDESGDDFGGAVAVGDATGDGYADIAVGAPYEDVDGHRNVGDVVFLRGGSTGLTTTGPSPGTRPRRAYRALPRPATTSAPRCGCATSTATAGRTWRSARSARTWCPGGTTTARRGCCTA